MIHKDKRVALITGGARGIGRSIAGAFAGEGTDLILTDIEGALLEETSRALSASSGIRIITEVMDVTDFDQVQSVVKRAAKDAGRVDILVNNAGITSDNLFIRMKPEEWRRVLDVNLNGTFNCCRAAIRFMTKQRYGRIINIISIAGVMGNIGQANYAASKAGIIGLTKTLAKEYAERGITVNAVAPGAVDTEMTAGLAPEVREEILASIPLKRYARAEEIADSVKFLASDSASYITGQVLNVNGGMYM
jgi:3-oxoacyl-[acyl-carrier protein] reductase